MSALLQTYFKDFRYVTLDLPTLSDMATREPDIFFERYPPPVIIDEVQYAPGIFRYIKFLVDRDRDRNGQFILAGSGKFALMHEVSESLAGRVELFELEPLSSHEIWNAYPDYNLNDMVVRGGFPELYKDITLPAREFHRSYIATYLERDVRNTLAVRNLRDFERFIRAAATRSARQLNKADLARDVGISPTAANEWLTVLEAANQLVLLEPWFSNKSLSVAKGPKLYFTDSGTLCYLLGIHTVEELLGSPFLGHVWETFVFGELRKREAFTGDYHKLWFWRDRDKEIDFLVHRGGLYDLYEAKWAESPDANDLKGFRDFEKKYPAGSIASRTLVGRPANRYLTGADNEVSVYSIRDLWDVKSATAGSSAPMAVQ